MDEFNRELNPIDEYAPVDNAQDFKTEMTGDTENKTVPIDTADEEDTCYYTERDVRPEPVSDEYKPVDAPVSHIPQADIPVNNTPSSHQYAQPQPSPVQYPSQQNMRPPYGATPVYNNRQAYPVNQYNQPMAYPPQPPVMQQNSTGYTQQPSQPQYRPVQNNPYVQNTTQNPYAHYQQVNNPYNPNPPQKPKTPTGTKVLIGILIGLLIIFMIGFFVSCSSYLGITDTDSGSDNPLSQYATEPQLDEYYDFEDMPYSPYFNSQSYEGDYHDEKITLMADEGNTQVSTDDKKANTYDPDKDAKGVVFEDLPKDKENSKYTTQSAYNLVADSVVSVVCYEDKITDNESDIIGEGTGTVISADGYIVTNSHVIGDTNTYKINIIFNNSDEYEAKVVGFDTRTDLAVLKIDAKNLSYTKFSDSSLVEVGQDVVAIGNPGGSSFQNSLTKGIVSAVERELNLGANVTYIQIDAAINPGNSGGPLCNLYGQVVGINTAKISADAYEGMGFAIPSNKVSEIANDLIHYGYVKDRVRIGIMGREVDEEMIYTYNVPNGVLITEISEDGPLYNTDIKEFDIITAIDGKEVSTFQEIFAILEDHKPGDKVEITVYRLEY